MYFDYYLKKRDNNINSIYINPCTPIEIVKVIKELKNKTSVGIDNISNKLIKSIVDSIAKPLSIIAKIIPIYKSKEKSLMNNYRPISLLPCISKLIEKILFDRVTPFLNANNIISKNQFCFRANYSTGDALIHFMNNLIEDKEKKFHNISVFLDLSKAFDTIDHKILISKLNYYGIRGNALEWFSNYLSGRYQYVDYKQANSEQEIITCGVPQGSVLGPMLFFIIYQ